MSRRKGLGRGLDGLISGGLSQKSPKPVTKKEPGKASKKTASKKAKEPAVTKANKPDEAILEGTRPFPDRKEHQDGIRETAVGLYEIPIGKISANPHQPRKEFEESALAELAESIRAEGLLQPVVVRKVDEVFELIAGERRWRACQQLNLKYIPARILSASETSSAILSLVENLQREDLNPIEEALGFASLLKDFDLTQEAVAERVGRSRASVANALRLLQLPREIQGFLSKKHLTVGHAKVLLGLEESESILFLARQAIERGWSVRELERQVNLAKGRTAGRRKEEDRVTPEAEQTAIRDLERNISSALNTRVQLKHSGKKGKLIIEYRGNDDLQRIMDKMGLKS